MKVNEFINFTNLGEIIKVFFLTLNLLINMLKYCFKSIKIGGSHKKQEQASLSMTPKQCFLC